MIKILVADDHLMFREGLISLINTLDNFEIVAQASTGKEAIISLKLTDTDVVLMDINMPEMDGIEALAVIKTDFPTVKVIMLTTYNDKNTIQKVLTAGADGYLLKNSGKVDLVKGITQVYEGESYFVDEVKDAMINSLRSPNIVGEIRLTPREKEILELIYEEFTTHEIAEKLFISANTVETHRKNLLSKTGCHNSIGLVKFAVKNELY